MGHQAFPPPNFRCFLKDRRTKGIELMPLDLLQTWPFVMMKRNDFRNYS